MLTFDPARHEYRWQGAVVPHVTGILAPLINYSRVPPDKLELARQKGVAVHQMVQLDCAGDLDEDALPEWMRPVLAKWRQFRAETGFQLIASEQPIYNKRYRYAGTLDLCCALPGTKLAGAGIIDIKRSFAAGATLGPQTAAYAQAREEMYPDVPLRWRAALRLREDQSFQLHALEDRQDWHVFLAALTLHSWKEKHQ